MYSVSRFMMRPAANWIGETFPSGPSGSLHCIHVSPRFAARTVSNTYTASAGNTQISGSFSKYLKASDTQSTRNCG